MAAARTVLHADMDAFYAAVEQRDRPELRGKPVVVGGIGPRSVVSTASYEARKFGVRSAMPGAEARRKCPHAIFVAPRMDVYAAVAAEIRAVFESYTDLVEPLSLDEAFLDATASRALFGDGESIARRLKNDVRRKTGLTVSVGVASNKFVAKIASDLRKPDGLVVVPFGSEEAFLDPLPVSRFWGAGAKALERFATLDLRTIGDVRRRSEGDLVAAFGATTARRFFEQARGLDRRPVVPDREAKSIGRETTFETDVVSGDVLRATLLKLCDDVGRRLRADGFAASTIRLKLRDPDFTTRGRQRRVEPTSDDAAIYKVARDLFDALWDKRTGVRLLGVSAASLSTETAVQGRLFESEDKKGSRVAVAVDRIRERFGKASIGRVVAPRTDATRAPEREGDLAP
jgi:DNA polymerase IV